MATCDTCGKGPMQPYDYAVIGLSFMSKNIPSGSLGSIGELFGMCRECYGKLMEALGTPPSS